jgi:hypothetical protein
MTWYLTHSGTKKSFAEWGLSNVTLKRRVLAVDTLNFTIDSRDLDNAFDFAHDDEIIIHRGDVIYFVGTIVGPADSASANQERHNYVAEGPWRKLERLVFLQHTKMQSGEVLIETDSARINLFSTITGGIQSVAEQATEVIQYAIDAGRSIQLGTIDMVFYPPAEEGINITCAEAIRRCARWVPDSIAWFDYSTTDGGGNPAPTFHFRPRANLTPITVDAETDSISDMSFRARSDQKLPGVMLIYETTSGKARVPLTEVWPPGTTGKEDGCAVLQFDIRGPTTTFLKQAIETETYAPQTSAFWEKYDKAFGALHSAGKITNFVFHDGYQEGMDPGTHPYILTKGQITQWMIDDNLIEVGEGTVWGIVSYNVIDNDGNVYAEANHKYMVMKGIFCNKASQTFYSLDSYESGDTPPVGMAKALYDQYSELHHEGSLTLLEKELGARNFMGRLLNVAGIAGRPTWATMRGYINSVVEELPDGATKVTVGIPPYLNIGDLISLLINSRTRRQAKRIERATGQTEEGYNPLQLGDYFGVSSSAAAEAPKSREVFTAPSGGANVDVCSQPTGSMVILTGGGTAANIEINTADLPTGKTARFQAVTDPCTGGTAYILMTEPE